jgi:site-specific DNA-methyltransferase (adenine-specific)
MQLNQIIQGDSLEVLKSFDENSISTVICDPPYGLSSHPEKVIRKVFFEWLNGNDGYIPDTKGFMGKSWDAFVPPPALWREVYRVMKPGGTILCFAGSRTQDLMAMSLRLAGFEIKDTIMWLYGQGFPKSTDISKQINKKLGAKRKVVGKHPNPAGTKNYKAKQWEGYSSHSLKPSYEPIILAMKANDGSYAENALKYGVAGLNIDGGRIGNITIKSVGGRKSIVSGDTRTGKALGMNAPHKPLNTIHTGRFPSNTLLECICDEVIEKENSNKPYSYQGKTYKVKGFIENNKPQAPSNYNDTKSGIIHTNPECPCYMLDEQKKGVYRFFYCAKASRSERNVGLEGMGGKVDCDRNPKLESANVPMNRSNNPKINFHPTIKPLALMEYLVKLTSMPNPDQIYLDPFLGSGTTAMACKKLGKKWIGIELNPQYIEIAKKRIEAVIVKQEVQATLEQ